MYKVSKTTKPFGEIISIQTENKCIPIDPANTDYQAYLKWLEESPDNVPLPAENE